MTANLALVLLSTALLYLACHYYFLYHRLEKKHNDVKEHARAVEGQWRMSIDEYHEINEKLNNLRSHADQKISELNNELANERDKVRYFLELDSNRKNLPKEVTSDFLEELNKSA